MRPHIPALAKSFAPHQISIRPSPIAARRFFAALSTALLCGDFAGAFLLRKLIFHSFKKAKGATS